MPGRGDLSYFVVGKRRKEAPFLRRPEDGRPGPRQMKSSQSQLGLHAILVLVQWCSSPFLPSYDVYYTNLAGSLPVPKWLRPWSPPPGSSNLLISSDGHLKIGDWGLARLQADNDGKQYYTNRVITLWYRPPELLLGSTKSADGYGTSADVWSIGCILAELLYAKPILPGNTEIEQLALIFELCGTPTVEDWPNVLGAEYLQSNQA